MVRTRRKQTLEAFVLSVNPSMQKCTHQNIGDSNGNTKSKTIFISNPEFNESLQTSEKLLPWET